MESARIQVVVASPQDLRSVTDALSGTGHTVVPAESLDAVLDGRGGKVEARVVAETAFPGGEAGPFLAELTEREPHVPCVVIVQDGTVARTVELMRRGAFCVVPGPVEAEQLVPQVEQALRHRELCLRNAELRRSLEAHERLAMIGKLAAGVAHELNNPLDGVLRFVNLAVESLPRDAQEVPYLMEARRGLRRMADIVRDLLQFSRNAAVESSDEDARRLAEDAVTQVIALEPHKRILAEFDFPLDGLQLPRGMFQVFGNLAKNAVDSMPQGGRLKVSARVVDGRVSIDVTDSGTGIPEEIRDRIFEPFFTTKEVGRGTGLGLPICQRIVERLGGTLELMSEVGKGTTVRMSLPTSRSARGRKPPGLGRPVHAAPAAIANLVAASEHTVFLSLKM